MQHKPSAAPLSWDDIRFFLALTRARSLTEAGRALGVEGSTMSRRLDSLEESLATVLFERSREGITLTEAGAQLKPKAEEMEYLVAQFEGDAQRYESEVSGAVSIACPGDAAEILLAPLVPELLSLHPGLRIDIIPGEGVVDMVRRDADIALRTVRPTSGDLVTVPLMSVGWRLVRGPSSVSHAPLTSLHDVPWVVCGRKTQGATPGRWFQKHVEGTGKVQPVLSSDSLTVQLACVRAGVGVALVPQPSIRASGLQEVELCPKLARQLGPWPQDELFMVTHQSLRRVPRIVAVWEFLRKRVPETTGVDPSKKQASSVSKPRGGVEFKL